MISLILSTTDISHKLKLFLMIEPFLSLVFTFGGIYFLWKEIHWMKYVIMFSGFFMTASYTASVFIILKQAFSSNNK